MDYLDRLDRLDRLDVNEYQSELQSIQNLVEGLQWRVFFDGCVSVAAVKAFESLHSVAAAIRGDSEWRVDLDHVSRTFDGLLQNSKTVNATYLPPINIQVLPKHISRDKAVLITNNTLGH